MLPPPLPSHTTRNGRTARSPGCNNQRVPFSKECPSVLQQNLSLRGTWHHHSDWNQERTCIGRVHWQHGIIARKPTEAFPQPPGDCPTWTWRRDSCCVGHQCCSSQGSVIDCCSPRALNHPVSDVSESHPESACEYYPDGSISPIQRKYLGGELECSAQAVPLLKMPLTRVPQDNLIGTSLRALQSI